MGVIDHLVIIHRIAFAILLGFATAAFFCVIFLSGRGHHGHYTGDGIGPIQTYGDWVKEGQGQVPLFLKLWIALLVGICVSLTGIVIYHGYRY